MDIIVGHKNLDFDCVASMVAAKKMHPGARLYLQPTVEGAVLEFLNLYRDHFSFFRFSQYRGPKVSTAVVVDTNKRERLGPYEDGVRDAEKLVLYDHHPVEQGDLDPDERLVGDAGALVSLLVDKIRENGLGVSPFEATLFMLGLHQETGSLQFGTTLPLDYEAGRYLLERGADLDLVQSFCNRPLNEAQRDLLNELIDTTETLTVNHVPVTLAVAERDKYVPEVALLAHKLRDMENTNFLLLLVRMNQRIQLVVRNRLEHVDAGALAQQFGGGGHKRAASATLTGITLSEARESLMELLEDVLRPELTARQIMSSPVNSIRVDLSVREAHRLMLELGHHGLPITDEDQNLQGVITRSDVDKAVEHELTHAPVKGFMTPDVLTISPDTGLREIQDLMTENQVGRLPVTDESGLLGIVTRTDVVRVLHERYRPARVKDTAPAYSTDPDTDNIKILLNQRLEDRHLERLKIFGKVARELDERLFLVGGSVRDILLEITPGELDLVIDRDAIQFGEEVAARLNAKLRTHEKFRTATLKLNSGETIDLATARSEYYSHPAALPKVNIDRASIYQDLRRRDFTINSMAVEVTPKNYGKLLDLYGGRQDLEARQIKVLYATSFLDDPIRILRAVRFAARFNFEIEKSTSFQLEQALKGEPFTSVSGDRIRDELDRSFEEPEPGLVIRKLFENDIFPTVDDELVWRESMIDWFDRAADLLADEPDPERPCMIYYCLLFKPLDVEKALSLTERFMFNQRRRRIIRRFKEFEQIKTDVEFASSKSKLYALLKDYREREVFLALRASENENVRQKLRKYQEEIEPVTRLVNGKDLKRWGEESGPRLGRILEELYTYQLDSGTSSREEIKEYYQRQFGGEE